MANWTALLLIAFILTFNPSHGKTLLGRTNSTQCDSFVNQSGQSQAIEEILEGVQNGFTCTDTVAKIYAEYLGCEYQTLNDTTSEDSAALQASYNDEYVENCADNNFPVHGVTVLGSFKSKGNSSAGRKIWFGSAGLGTAAVGAFILLLLHLV
ncbi:hypothetical protein B0H11DRAFT_2269439 [Mycena galericulata]|nr:hypothetical protein B0H11DRAFT_2269439 [Mycena galericulata]